jgi:voltage-gated potassium channel
MRKQQRHFEKKLHTRAWFPHVPLAILVGCQGVLHILVAVLSLRTLRRVLAAPSLSALAGGVGIMRIGDVTHIVVGVLLVVVAVGMLWRSRVAWVLALLLTLATVALEFSPLSRVSRPLEIFSVVQLLLLLAARRSFGRSSLATATLFAFTAVALTLGYGTFGALFLGDGFQPHITTYTNAAYFSIETMSTVGYGDIVPVTREARLFTMTLIALGLGVFATSLPVIAGPLIDKRLMNLLQPRRTLKMKRVEHIIVVGDGALAQDAVRALLARGMTVTHIVAAAPAAGEEQSEDTIVGDGSDAETLGNAGVESARAVLALSEDDAYNAFVVLAAKEMNEQVRTVAAVSDTRNTGRVARTRPDVLLTLPLLGGELLAMALSGEEIKTDALITQLLKLG